MKLTISGEVNLEVEMTADISSNSNATDLKITARVLVGNEYIDIDITSAVSEHDKKMATTAIEDAYREHARDAANYGRGA